MPSARSPRRPAPTPSSRPSRSVRRARPICCASLSWLPRRRATPDDARTQTGSSAVLRFASCDLDIAPVDLLGQLLDQLGNALQVRVDGERAAERVERALVVAELLQDDSQSRERAEMARLARQHFVDVGERAAEVFLRVVDGRATVPRLGEIRSNIDDG